MPNRECLEGLESDAMNQQPLDSGVGTSEVTQWREANLANEEPRCRRTTFPLFRLKRLNYMPCVWLEIASLL
jgi:hypothetical protein